MKKLLYLLLFLSGYMIAEQTVIIDSVMQREEYPVAYQLLVARLNKTWVDWYNLGCCAYKTRQFDVAHRAWDIAYHGAINAGDAMVASRAYNNRSLVEKEWQCYSVQPMELLLLDWTGLLFGWIPMLIWQMVSLLLLSIIVGLWLWCGKNQRRRIVLLMLLWIFSLIPVVSMYMLKSVSRACVVATTASLHLGPHENYQTRGTVQYGDWLIRIDSRKEWSLVQSPSAKGWIKKDAIVCT